MHTDIALLRPALPHGASLSKFTLDAFLWRLLSESSKLVLQVGVQITLARLLPVETFGLMAIAMVVMNLGARVSEMGTGPALIQRPTITATHVRVAFTLSVLFGSSLSIAIWFGAGVAGTLFKAPAVTSALRLMGLAFVFTSFGATADALLQRRMDYRRLLRVELVSYAFGYAVVGIVLALLGYGIWALAWAVVAQTIVRTAMLLLMLRHPARPCLRRRETQELLNFGVGMTLGGLASFAAQNSDYFVAARWLGTTALGLYSRAYQLMYLPIYAFASILNLVLFPAYSTIQTDRERVARGYLSSVSLSALVAFPVYAAVAIAAPEVMTGVFGPPWAPAATPLRILCLAGAFYCVYNLADSLVRALGAVYEKFFYQAIYAFAVFAGAYACRGWNIVGVASAVLGSTALVYLLMAHVSLRLTHSGWRPFFRAQLPGLAVSAAVVAIALPAAIALRAAGAPPLIVLGGTLTAAAAAAAATALTLPRRWFTANVREMVAYATATGVEMAAGVLRRYRPETP